MRRITRLDRSIGLLQAKPSANHSPHYLCSACTPPVSSFSTSLRIAEQNKQPIFTEKVRQKLWGTDNPPGAEDPYGDSSLFDKTKKQKSITAFDEVVDVGSGRKETKQAKKLRKETRRSRASLPMETTAASIAANKASLKKRQFRAVERNLRSYIKSAGELDESYVPAEAADGLLEVGPLPPRWGEVWDKHHPIPSFLPARRETDGEIITAALHRAIVEVLALKESGEKNITEFSMATPSGYDLTDYVQIIASPSGPILQFSANVSLELIVKSLSHEKPLRRKDMAGVLEARAARAALKEQKRLAYEEDQARRRAEWLAAGGIVKPKAYASKQALHAGVDETKEKVAPTESEADVAADRSTVDPLNEVLVEQTYAATIKSWNPSWLHVPLTDSDVKFAVIKRTMQLTGVRLSDSIIQSANTAQALLDHFITLPKPRKLAEALLEKEKLLSLPNVSIYPRRLVPSDKETSVGRWKVIEKELTERGLPIFGRG